MISNKFGPWTLLICFQWKKSVTVKIINNIIFNLSNISYNRRSEDKIRLIKLKEINKKELNKIRLFKTIHWSNII